MYSRTFTTKDLIDLDTQKVLATFLTFLCRLKIIYVFLNLSFYKYCHFFRQSQMDLKQMHTFK